VNAGNNGSILGVAAGVWAVQTTAQLGFGTAAFVGTGLAAGQVPLNSNLGTAAYVNTGASAAHHRYQLFFQLTRITRDKGALAKDDRLDALAMAVAYWAKAMSVETEKVVQQNRDKLMQKELERYMQHAIGARPAGMVYATTMHR
jgi:hypothetical protein